MEIKFNRKEIGDLIKKYYKEKENADVSVNIRANRECVGRYETMDCVVRFTIKKTINILGVEKSATITLSEEEVLGIINELLNNTEYEVTSIGYDSGIHQETVGYYMSEHTEYKAYFNGIIVNVKLKNQKNRKLGV